MTKITFYRNHNGQYIGFECRDHSGFADAGSDVVCASVSALVINTANSLEAFADDPVRTEASEEGAVIRVSFPGDHSRECDVLIRSLVLGIESIGEQPDYRDYVDIHFEEV